jgi:hypothetical protein
LFAAGLLEMGGPEGHDVLNCEPNGGLFFGFAEFFLMRAGLGGADRDLAHRWARLALAAERIFIEKYQPAVQNVLYLENYSYRNGPFDDRAPASFLERLEADMKGLPSTLEELVAAHHAIVRSARGPRGSDSETT